MTSLTFALELLFKNWRIIGVATLLLIIGFQHILSLKDEKEIEGLKTRFQLEIVAREAAVREVKSRSDSTLRSVKDEHSKLVAAAEANAWRNLKRKYNDASRSPIAIGIRGDNSIGVRIPTDTGSSSTADSAKSPNGTTEGIMAFDGGLLEKFATDCALDAVSVVAWQRWATENRFPIEK